MNSLRSLLLSRHTAAEPRLDAVRRRIVATLPAPAPDHDRAPSVLRLAWEEIFVRARVAWTSLALGCLAALALHAAGPTASPAPTRATPAVSAAEIRAERAALWADLHALPPPPPALPEARDRVPRRSSLRRILPHELPA